MTDELSDIIRSSVPNFTKDGSFKLQFSKFDAAAFGDSVAEYKGHGLRIRASRERGEIIFEARLDSESSKWISLRRLPAPWGSAFPNNMSEQGQVSTVISLIEKDQTNLLAALQNFN